MSAPHDKPSTGDSTSTVTLGRRSLLQAMGAGALAVLGGCGNSAEVNGAESDASSGSAATSPSLPAAAPSPAPSPAPVSSPSDAASAPAPAASAAPAAAPAPAHPRLLHTEADFTRIRTKLAEGAQPWTEGWQALLAGWSAPGYAPRPLAQVIRGGDGSNFGRMIVEVEHAYQSALRWKIGGETSCAEQAIALLNAWSSTMTELTGNADRFLAAGIYGYQWANAAEIMRTYPGWEASDVARFQQWLLDHFYSLSHSFLTEHNGTEANKITNYWANWDLCNIAGILSIGVFCDRQDLVDEAVTYYKTGRGMGSCMHNVVMLHPGYLGQWQETGRDQGHATLGIALASVVCEMAWNQGIDLYGLADNRLLAGAEYVAKCNLADASNNLYDLPFGTYTNIHGTMTAISAAARPAWRPCWEGIYNHYARRQGLSAPWLSVMAAHVRPEGQNAQGDQLCYGTLAFSRDPAPAGGSPSSLKGFLTGGATVQLSWWGRWDATSYNVKRATSPSGRFELVATVTDPRTWADSPGQGTWYYAVTAVSPSGESALSNVARVVVGSELRVHLALDEGTGTRAADSTGNAMAGTLLPGTAWGAGRQGGFAVSMDGSTGHVALPAGVVSTLGDFTIAVWVYSNQAVANTRIFDFGFNDVTYMSLVPGAARGGIRFMVTTASSFQGEQGFNTAQSLPTGRWVHVAVTLSGTVGTIYVDGTAAGSADGILLAPWQLGTTPDNWLGRSHYAADPRFNGRMQDLRIYSGALSATEIAALQAG